MCMLLIGRRHLPIDDLSDAELQFPYFIMVFSCLTFDCSSIVITKLWIELIYFLFQNWKSSLSQKFLWFEGFEKKISEHDCIWNWRALFCPLKNSLPLKKNWIFKWVSKSEICRKLWPKMICILHFLKWLHHMQF